MLAFNVVFGYFFDILSSTKLEDMHNIISSTIYVIGIMGVVLLFVGPIASILTLNRKDT